MAKKVVASFKKGGSTAKDFTKIIHMLKKKNGAYEFKEEVISSEDLQEFLKKNE